MLAQLLAGLPRYLAKRPVAAHYGVCRPAHMLDQVIQNLVCYGACTGQFAHLSQVAAGDLDKVVIVPFVVSLWSLMI